MPRDDYDDDDRPRRRRAGKVACPECGSRYQHAGPWPWYLGTVGMMFCKAVVCEDCGHHFDAKKPNADLATRKRNLAIAINGVGLIGILLVFGCLGAWVMYTVKR